jgi:hypothetical protein
MFLCAIAGNGLGGTGILVRISKPEQLLRQLPWLIGMLGTITMDCFIMWQLKQSKQKQAARLAYSSGVPNGEAASPGVPLLLQE